MTHNVFNLCMAFIIGITLTTVKAEAATTIERNDLKESFTTTQGSFVLYDEQKDEYIVVNNQQSEKPLSPCSTFKIWNTLIGLESGALKDQSSAFINEETQKQCSLEEAIKTYQVWYYQKLAAKIGPTTMSKFLTQLDYGNQDISGGISQFWLYSSLKISTKDQVRLLIGLYQDKLAFSKKNMDLVKQLLVMSDTDGVKVSGRLGFAADAKGTAVLGWYIGCIEKSGNRYFFATNVEGDGVTSAGYKEAMDIGNGILTQLKVK